MRDTAAWLLWQILFWAKIFPRSNSPKMHKIHVVASIQCHNVAGARAGSDNVSGNEIWQESQCPLLSILESWDCIWPGPWWLLLWLAWPNIRFHVLSLSLSWPWRWCQAAPGNQMCIGLVTMVTPSPGNGNNSGHGQLWLDTSQAQGEYSLEQHF